MADRYESLRSYLTMMHEFKAKHTGNGRTLEGDVLRHGEWFVWSPLPDGIEYGEAKNCFGNAANLAIATDLYGSDNERGRFQYFEGYGMTPGLGLTVEHAWCIDRRTGQVVDNTWRSGGRECGFCDGDGTREEPELDEDGEDYGYTIEVECAYCDGTGDAGFDHENREGTVYVGIHVPTELLSRIIMRDRTYTVFKSQAAVDEVLAANAAT